MRTIVVGGGIAGLWTAKKLAERGDEVVLVEKNDRLGGRILTSAKYGYEIGAGRIHNSHKHVRQLVKHYGLTTIPISGETQWYPLSSASGPEPNPFDTVWAAFIQLVETLPADYLRQRTLCDVAVAILGREMALALLEKYPYRAETERMRADVGIIAFKQEMRSNAGFFVVKEGLSAIVDGLEKDCRALDVQIHLGQEVRRLKRDGRQWAVRIGGQEIVADRIVLALPAEALRPLLHDWPKLRHLGMEPLTRIYAKFPHLDWYTGPKTVSDSPLRYIIPINREAGTIMISYTDDRDTAHWKGLKEGHELNAAILREVRRLWKEAPAPLWVHRYEWSAGCSYWVPGNYSPTDIIREAQQLEPGLHICGESFSYRQAWVEGALESAAALLKRL